MTLGNKLVIYTALFGDYDLLQEPKGNYEGCDFICFTDQYHISSEYWTFVYVESDQLTSSMLNRKYKILPHLFLSGYSMCLYIDANIKLVSNPIVFVAEMLKFNVIAAPCHFLRDCVYDEAIECMNVGKISALDYEQFVSECVKLEYPKHHGLTENNILLRRHMADDCIRLMNKWWALLLLGPQRDQLMLPLAAWLEKVDVMEIHISSRVKNDFFRYFLHKKDKGYGVFNKIVSFLHGHQKYGSFYPILYRLYAFLFSMKKL